MVESCSHSSRSFEILVPETKTQPGPHIIGHPGPNTDLGAFSVPLHHRQEALCSGKLEEAQQKEDGK